MGLHSGYINAVFDYRIVDDSNKAEEPPAQDAVELAALGLDETAQLEVKLL